MPSYVLIIQRKLSYLLMYKEREIDLFCVYLSLLGLRICKYLYLLTLSAIRTPILKKKGIIVHTYYRIVPLRILLQGSEAYTLLYTDCISKHAYLIRNLI